MEFSLGATHKLEKGAVHQGVTGLHLSIVHGTMQPSVSTQIAALRQGLLAAQAHEGDGEISARFADVIRVRGFRVHGRVSLPISFARPGSHSVGH